MRTPLLKVASFTAISATALLGACASMDRSTWFDSPHPPASAEARNGRPAPAAPQERAEATSPQQMNQGSANPETSGQAPPPSQAQAAAPDQMAQAAPPAAASATGPFTDMQLQSFVTASRQIEPLNRQVATATPEQRTQLATQIRAILTQNNLDGATYNAIATQAQSDHTLASRIAAIQGNPNG